MSRRNNAFDFPTNRDRDAFGEVLKRSNLSYAKGEFYRVEFVGNPVEADCKSCGCGHANVRLVFNYGAPPNEADEFWQPAFGSDEYCLHCFKRGVRDWIGEMMEQFTDQYTDYRAKND